MVMARMSFAGALAVVVLIVVTVQAQAQIRKIDFTSLKPPIGRQVPNFCLRDVEL